MRAAVARNGVIGVEEIAEPVPGPGQVLVKPLACGICGSDVHLLQSQASMPEAIPPIVLGHEFIGEIIDYGPDTERRFDLGTIVSSVPYLDHETGPQHIGVSPLAGGALAERMVLQERRLEPVLLQPSPEYAVVAEPLSVGTHAVGVANMRPGDVPLVIGCGPIGLAVIAALKAAGYGPVVAADFSDVRRRFAETVGADIVVDPGEVSPYATWSKLTGPEIPNSCLIEAAPTTRTVVFECVGAPGVLDTIINSVPSHTRVVIVGACLKPDTITPAIAVMKELQLTFSYGYRPDEFAQSLKWVADGRFDPKPWVTAKMPLDEVADAYAALSYSPSHCKILLIP